MHIGFNELVQAINNLPADQRRYLQTVLEANTSTAIHSQERIFGTMPGLITYMADDFDAPLADFDEYM